MSLKLKSPVKGVVVAVVATALLSGCATNQNALITIEGKACLHIGTEICISATSSDKTEAPQPTS